VFERGRATIPEMACAPCPIDERRHIARADLAINSAGAVVAVGERLPRLVTTGACEQAVSGQSMLMDSFTDGARKRLTIVVSHPDKVAKTPVKREQQIRHQNNGTTVRVGVDSTHLLGAGCCFTSVPQACNNLRVRILFHWSNVALKARDDYPFKIFSAALFARVISRGSPIFSATCPNAGVGPCHRSCSGFLNNGRLF